ncbi:MAG: hypothetical protein ACK4TD_17215 [Ectopseudomonas guguanensis]|uniref:hypothetical protein n=1 Tax=Ectopseudomonas guguanensis TaxID=1198456 RepID=UPI00391B1AE4
MTVPTTAIEVIDTAIKIGLGGIIGFASTYVVTKLNHKHDSRKDITKRHYDALEQVAAHVEVFSHVALKYWALVAECVRVENDGREWPKERSEQLDLAKAEYFSEAKNITVAESKLLLLGLESSSVKLRKYTDFLKTLRRQYYIGKAGLTEKEMDEAREELLQLRQEFFAELSSAYKNGL